MSTGLPIVQITQTGAGTPAFVVPDFFQNPFNIGLQVTVSGTVNYTVSFTLDNVLADGYVQSTGNWQPIQGLQGVSASTIGQLTIPCRGIQLTVNSGTGTATLSIQQAGNR